MLFPPILLAVEKEKLFQKFATLCLFVKTSPINLAGISGNGNKRFYRALGYMFKLQTTRDRHSPRLIIDDSLLPNPPVFS
jgi:hypothetical protein